MKQDRTKIISGKDLGQLALNDFCPRCFWLERKYGKPPSIFPGIFSTIDSLTKKSVKRSCLENNRLPGWLTVKNAVRAVDFPRISIPMLEFGNWVLTGDPDEVLELSDGSYHVLDYKTAKFTDTQDQLLPMYETQLNVYALALPAYGIKPISKLSLLYCEPKEELDSDEHFCLSFIVQELEIKLRPEIVPELLSKARAILDEPSPPAPRVHCQGICAWLERPGAEIAKADIEPSLRGMTE